MTLNGLSDLAPPSSESSRWPGLRHCGRQLPGCEKRMILHRQDPRVRQHVWLNGLVARRDADLTVNALDRCQVVSKPETWPLATSVRRPLGTHKPATAGTCCAVVDRDRSMVGIVTDSWALREAVAEGFRGLSVDGTEQSVHPVKSQVSTCCSAEGIVESVSRKCNIGTVWAAMLLSCNIQALVHHKWTFSTVELRRPTVDSVAPVCRLSTSILQRFRVVRRDQ